LFYYSEEEGGGASNPKGKNREKNALKDLTARSAEIQKGIDIQGEK